MKYSILMTAPGDVRVYKAFPDEHSMVLYLETLDIEYDPKLGYARFSDGRFFEYGKIGG